MFSRTYRVVVALKLIVTVLAFAVGSNVYPAEATMSLKLEPSVLPRTARVSVRAPQDVDGGSFRTTWLTATEAPRSTCSHCGKALSALSQ